MNQLASFVAQVSKPFPGFYVVLKAFQESFLNDKAQI